MKRRLVTYLCGVVLVVLLTSCGTPPTAPTATVVPMTPTVTQPTATVLPTQAPSPTAASTPTEVVKTDTCVTCHTDKDQLISTANQVEEQVKESEGAG
jgi:hypothetical protein